MDSAGWLNHNWRCCQIFLGYMCVHAKPSSALSRDAVLLRSCLWLCHSVGCLHKFINKKPTQPDIPVKTTAIQKRNSTKCIPEILISEVEKMLCVSFHRLVSEIMNRRKPTQWKQQQQLQVERKQLWQIFFFKEDGEQLNALSVTYEHTASILGNAALCWIIGDQEGTQMHRWPMVGFVKQVKLYSTVN